MTIVPIAELLRGARRDDHGVAFRAGRIVTVAELRRDVLHNARRLARLPSHRSLLLCEDAYWFLVGLVALMQLGSRVIVPPNSQPGTLQELSGAFDLMVADSPHPEAVDPFILERGADAPIATIDLGSGELDFFTSGSTGAAKRVTKSLRSFEREASALEALFGEMLGALPVLGMVPHQHVYGATFRLLWPLLAGRAFSADTYFAWEILLHHLAAPAMIVSSPAHLTRIGGIEPIPKARQPRIIFSAGALLRSVAAAEVACIFGAPPIQIFGSTETGAIAWQNSVDDAPMWRPLPGVEVSTTAEGLMCLRSSFLDGEPQQTLADRVCIANDGRFQFEGRADRIVKVEGVRISVQKLENDILALPWIADAAVAAVADHRTILGVIATLSPEGKAELVRLGKFRFERMLRQSLAKTSDSAALPRKWRFVETIPLDGMGKRLNQDIARLLQASA